MDNRMDKLDKYIYMRDGTLVYESLYQKQFTPEEFDRLFALCEDHLNDERIKYNAVIDEWEEKNG